MWGKPYTRVNNVTVFKREMKLEIPIKLSATTELMDNIVLNFFFIDCS